MTEEITMEEATFYEILNHLEIAEDALKELVFDDENVSATIAKNEILEGLGVLERWYYNGQISPDED